MNDLFYFNETYSLPNYADDNTLYMIWSTIETVLSDLRTDNEHPINWLIDNFIMTKSIKISIHGFIEIYK